MNNNLVKRNTFSPETIHLAHCYLGQTFQEAIDEFSTAMTLKNTLGSNFPNNDKFGNQSVQNGVKDAVAGILHINSKDLTITYNTNHSLQIIKAGLNLNLSPKIALLECDYLDLHTPFLNRAEVSENLRATPIFIKCNRDNAGRPIGFELKEFERVLKLEKPFLTVISHVQFTNGFTADLNEISNICEKNGVYLVIDVAQSFGVLPLNLNNLNVAAVITPLWKWTGGCRGNTIMFTHANFRDKLKIGFPTTSTMNVHDWLANIETSDFFNDGRKFETSTLPTESLIITRAMLEAHAKNNISEIAHEIVRLHEIAKQNLQSDMIDIFKPKNKISGSFLAITLNGKATGKEKELIGKLNANNGKKVILTERGGFLRFAPHYYTNEGELLEACDIIKYYIKHVSS